MSELLSLRRSVVLGLVVLVAMLAVHCATPTALTVTVYSEVPCAKGSSVSLVGGASLAELAQKVPSSASTTCEPDGRMGRIVVVPAGAKDGTIAFAVMQRADGQPADECLQSTQARGCIVAKRQLRFEKHSESDMRIDLRLSCLGVLCSPEQTCVQGACVDAQTTCAASCDENTLGPRTDGGAPEASVPETGAPDAPIVPSGLLTLTLSAGTLSPAFSPATRSYAVAPSVVSLGVPFTITPTLAAGSSATINGVAAASGVASPVVALALMAPTPVDVTVTSAAGVPTHYAIVVPPVQEAYVKASTPRSKAGFGCSVALSGDTLAVGARSESSNATGINGNQDNASASDAGAVYVFTRSGATWVQQAYIKASNTRAGSSFGASVALSGNTLAVGALGESSAAIGVNSNLQGDTSAPGAGAVYVFTRSGATWSQQAYVKSFNTFPNAAFGASVALEGDNLAVGSYGERNPASGINPLPSAMGITNAGAAYVFTRIGTIWSQDVYIKASNTRPAAQFGYSVALSDTKGLLTLAVGANQEPSAAKGVNGDQMDQSAFGAGAVYVFTRSNGPGTAWSQQAYVKASNTRSSAFFGASLALAGDTLVVGAVGEASTSTGINGDQTNANAQGSGAAYVFTRSGIPPLWSQQAYVKASNTRQSASFGNSLALSGDTLAVGSYVESSNATGVNGNQADSSSPRAGAAYVLTRTGTTWSQQAYVKASNTRQDAAFGSSLALAGDTLVLGSAGESGSAPGINGDQTATDAMSAGAVYILR